MNTFVVLTAVILLFTVCEGKIKIMILLLGTVDGQIKLGQKKKQSQVKIYKFASFNYGFITNRLTLV
jgi:hypothetical protein